MCRMTLVAEGKDVKPRKKFSQKNILQAHTRKEKTLVLRSRGQM